VIFDEIVNEYGLSLDPDHIWEWIPWDDLFPGRAPADDDQEL
jgi:hypothetical protein